MSEQAREELWTRHASYFVVEIFVGATWTEAAKVTDGDLDAAISVARKLLMDRSVSKVRVCEHDIVHVNSRVFTAEAGPELRIPPKMTPTGEYGSCRICKAKTHIASDGQNRWAFCEGCERALPAA